MAHTCFSFEGLVSDHTKFERAQFSKTQSCGIIPGTMAIEPEAAKASNEEPKITFHFYLQCAPNKQRLSILFLPI